MATNNLETAKEAYRKASEEYGKALVAEITRIVENSLGEYGFPSYEEKISYGDPVVSGRPTDIYIASKSKDLHVEVVSGYMEEDMDDVLVSTLPVESLETLLMLLKRPLDD